MPILYIRDELNEQWLAVVSELGAIPDVFADDVEEGYTLIYHASGSPGWYAETPGGGVSSQLIFTVEGSVSAEADPLRITNYTGRTLHFQKAALDVDTAPEGADLIVDLHLDGTTVFTNQAHRPTITSGSDHGESSDFDVTSWPSLSELEMIVDQIGSGTPGSDLVVIVVYN